MSKTLFLLLGLSLAAALVLADYDGRASCDCAVNCGTGLSDCRTTCPCFGSKARRLQQDPDDDASDDAEELSDARDDPNDIDDDGVVDDDDGRDDDGMVDDDGRDDQDSQDVVPDDDGDDDLGLDGISLLRETEGFDAYEKRRQGQYDKKIDTGAMQSGERFDQGADQDPGHF